MKSIISPIPAFYDPTKSSSLFQVPYQQRFMEAKKWAKQNNLHPAATDSNKIALLIIDAQNSFCLPDGELFVMGAEKDSERICEFIYKNINTITKTIPTLDTHTVAQIFHQSFWINDGGETPEPMTMISLEDVKKGIWKVNPAMSFSIGASYPLLQKYALHYVQKLSENNKYDLTIWPFHCLLSGIGHAMVSLVEEAVFFHGVARSSQPGFQIKGGNPLTENYSVLRPEVLEDGNGRPIAQKNVKFIETLLEYDAVIIGGQAKSHCVAWTIADLLDEINSKDPALAQKVYLLEDCTSPVVIPGIIDFTSQADDAFKRFSDAGMHVVKSTDLMEDWPGLNL